MYTLYVLVFVSAIWSFIKWRERNLKREKEILEKKVEQRTKQLSEAKKHIEEKQKDILDSIHYAKRIQQAMLKEEEHISAHLPEHFILFLPKDIVSGDFYWSYELKVLPTGEDSGGALYWYLAAVDCTGHGVPGAMMSMLGMSFLNDIISAEQLLAPSEILNQLRDKIVKELHQTGKQEDTKDGMDISLIRLNLQTKELQWAGANNSLYIIQKTPLPNGEGLGWGLSEIKGDKQPIGYHPLQKPFTNHEIQLQKGESIYIFSDGYADQFGGPKEKKFKYKQLEELVMANCYLPLTGQKAILKKTFIDWVGNSEQTDDVCIIGVKI